MTPDAISWTVDPTRIGGMRDRSHSSETSATCGPPRGEYPDEVGLWADELLAGGLDDVSAALNRLRPW
jgi:hypothetical protein